MVAADLRSAFASASAAAVVAWRAAREGRRGGPAGAAELPLLDRDGEGRQGAPPGRLWGGGAASAGRRWSGAQGRRGGRAARWWGGGARSGGGASSGV